MLSTKTETINGQLKNPFGGNQSAYAGFNSSFNQYRNNFQANFQLLKRRFSHEDSNKIKDLLEQFDNNIQMVTDILLESQDKQPMVCEKPNSKKLEIQEQNRVLKNAIARLYKKLVQQEKQVDTLKFSQQRLKRQNDDLKLQNRFLLEKQFGTQNFETQRDIF